MKSREQAWPIGEVAEQLGLETHVLRHWEQMGLVAPGRDGAGRRRYVAADLVRIATVIRSKSAGMSLEQIREMLDADAHGRHRLLEGHLADLDRRLEDLARARAMTEHAFGCHAHDITTCPRFREHVVDLVGRFG